MKKILRFTASWCGPCKSLAMSLEEANLSLPIEVIDIDTHSELAVEYGIRGVPTLVLTDGTVEIKRLVGSKTVAELKEWASV
jgi:thioredoxin 1